jgi:hypothetical protein
MRLRARIWQFFTTGSHTPWNLTYLLSLGCLLLFALFLVPSPLFNNVPPLFAEGGVNQDFSKSGPSRELPVQVLGMESKGRIYDETDEQAKSLQRERVAANILIRSGYLRSASVVDTVVAGERTIGYSFDVQPDVWECVLFGAEKDSDEPSTEQTSWGAESQDAAKLAIIAVAIEKFHRTALHRRAEWAYARAFLSAFGKLPDLSLGPAQIRPSRIRKISMDVAQRNGPYKNLHDVAHLPDSELANELSDECRSLRLAATIMYYYLTKGNECANENASENKVNCLGEEGDRNAFAARNYIGQRRTTSAIIDYAPIVASVVGFIGCKSSGCPEMPSDEQPTTAAPNNEPTTATSNSEQPPQGTEQNSGHTHQQKSNGIKSSAKRSKVLLNKGSKKRT